LYHLETGTARKSYVIEKGQSIEYEKNIWNPLISKSVNEKKIKLVVDGVDTGVDKSKLFMDPNLNLMISYKVLRQNFDCAVNLYNDKTLVLEKYNTKIEMDIKKNTAFINENEVELDSGICVKDDEIYVPLELVAREFNYDYQWNIQDNEIQAINNSSDNIIR
jgi:uncharacterized membrane protein